MTESLFVAQMDMDIEMCEVAGTCCICLCDIDQSAPTGSIIQLPCCRNNMHTYCFLQYCASLSAEKLELGIDCPLCRTLFPPEQFRQIISSNELQKYIRRLNFSDAFLEFYYPSPSRVSIRQCTIVMFFLLSLAYLLFIALFVLIIEHFRQQLTIDKPK